MLFIPFTTMVRRMEEKGLIDYETSGRTKVFRAALSRQDCELACDEGAIRRLGEGERLPYGRTLVDMIAAGRNSLLNTATTMTGGKRKVRERIKLIARRPKTVRAVALALIVILVCAVGCTFTGAPEKSPEPSLTTDTLRERL